jgi:hypothetical protein
MSIFDVDLDEARQRREAQELKAQQEAAERAARGPDTESPEDSNNNNNNNEDAVVEEDAHAEATTKQSREDIMVDLMFKDWPAEEPPAPEEVDDPLLLSEDMVGGEEAVTLTLVPTKSSKAKKKTKFRSTRKAKGK